MAKKLISVWLSLTILLFSSISIYADEIIQGEFFLKNIVINGENIVNYELSSPYLLHKDRVYIPMDTEMEKILGLDAEMDTESRTLKILKTDPARTDVNDHSSKNNLDDISIIARYDINVVAYTDAQNKDARLTGEQADATGSDQNAEAIELPELTAVQIDLKGQPVLVKNEIVYVPLNAIVSSETLGWTSYYDPYSGVYISTDDEIDAASYFNAETSRYYKALSAYILKKNPKLKMSQAFEMVKYFEAYGQIYGVDLKLLMAMAETESCFTSDIVNSSNCCGLMQIKVSTGNSFGFTKAQLLQVKPNIQMGAMYIGENLSIFGGDRVKALAGYNCGTYAVKQGNYSTGYANKVINRTDSIGSFVNSYNG